jgi:hypothetical protein
MHNPTFGRMNQDLGQNLKKSKEETVEKWCFAEASLSHTHTHILNVPFIVFRGKVFVLFLSRSAPE